MSLKGIRKIKLIRINKKVTMKIIRYPLPQKNLNLHCLICISIYKNNLLLNVCFFPVIKWTKQVFMKHLLCERNCAREILRGSVLNELIYSLAEESESILLTVLVARLQCIHITEKKQQKNTHKVEQKNRIKGVQALGFYLVKFWNRAFWMQPCSGPWSR